MKKLSVMMIMAVAGAGLTVPLAPAEAQNKSASSAASAQKAKPSPSRSVYSRKGTARTPVRQRTAAEVINPAAAARYSAYRNAKTARRPVPQAGLFARFGQRIAAIFRRGPRAGTTAASARSMRAGAVSVVIGRLRRDPAGTIQD
ncbi:MAG: hypothetical protein AAGL10_15025 [Pseudomonadota bacterium]